MSCVILTFWVEINGVDAALVFDERVEFVHAVYRVQGAVEPALEHHVIPYRFAARKCQPHLAVDHLWKTVMVL